MQEAEKVGIVSEEQAEITGALGNEVYALKQAFLSLRTEVATALAPIITKIVEFLRDSVIPKVKELIQKWKEMSSSLKVVIGVVGGVLTALGPIISIVAKVITMVMKLKEAVGALGGAMKILNAVGKAGPWVALISIIAVLLLQNENFSALLQRI